MTRKIISAVNPSIFDYQNWVETMAANATARDRLLTVVDFERFRKPLELPLRREARGPGGRPAFDAVLMFKVLVLQRLYNLSDDQGEFQIPDRCSFQRILGLTVADAMPDATNYLALSGSVEPEEYGRALFCAVSTPLASTGHSRKCGEDR